MVMAAGAVHVTVRELFFGSVTHVGDLDGEVQGLAGQRVVAVDGDVVAFDLADGDVDAALVIAALELHARLEVFHALERGARHHLDQLFVTRAVALFGGDVDLELVAHRAAFERLFQARNDVAFAMDVSQRLATVRAVDDVALVVGQRVMEGNGVAVGDLHGILSLGGGMERHEGAFPDPQG